MSKYLNSRLIYKVISEFISDFHKKIPFSELTAAEENRAAGPFGAAEPNGASTAELRAEQIEILKRAVKLEQENAELAEKLLELS